MLNNLQDAKLINIKTLLHKTILNIMTQMLFTRRYFTEDGFYNNKHEEFSDFVQYFKPFDLQGLLPQAREIFMEMDQFFDKIIHDHMNEKHADGSKDLVDVLLSLSLMEDFGDKLDDNKIKAILVVMFTLPHVDCNFRKFKDIFAY
jgi:cytochrome P450